MITLRKKCAADFFACGELCADAAGGDRKQDPTGNKPEMAFPPGRDRFGRDKTLVIRAFPSFLLTGGEKLCITCGKFDRTRF